MKTLLNPSASLRTGCSFGSFFSIMGYRRRILEIYRRLSERSLFLWAILVFFIGFIVFSFTFGHKIPYPKARFLAFKKFKTNYFALHSSNKVSSEENNFWVESWAI